MHAEQKESKAKQESKRAVEILPQGNARRLFQTGQANSREGLENRWGAPGVQEGKVFFMMGKGVVESRGGFFEFRKGN